MNTTVISSVKFSEGIITEIIIQFKLFFSNAVDKKYSLFTYVHTHRYVALFCENYLIRREMRTYVHATESGLLICPMLYGQKVSVVSDQSFSVKHIAYKYIRKYTYLHMYMLKKCGCLSVCDGLGDNPIEIPLCALNIIHSRCELYAIRRRH